MKAYPVREFCRCISELLTARGLPSVFDLVISVSVAHALFGGDCNESAITF